MREYEQEILVSLYLFRSSEKVTHINGYPERSLLLLQEENSANGEIKKILTMGLLLFRSQLKTAQKIKEIDEKIKTLNPDTKE